MNWSSTGNGDVRRRNKLVREHGHQSHGHAGVFATSRAGEPLESGPRNLQRRRYYLSAMLGYTSGRGNSVEMTSCVTCSEVLWLTEHNLKAPSIS